MSSSVDIENGFRSDASGPMSTDGRLLATTKPEVQVEVTFSYEGYRVTVTQDGTATLARD